MLIFNGGKGRGCIMPLKIDVRDSHGITLELPGGQTFPAKASGSEMPFITIGASFSLQEIVSHLRCFNDAIYTYAFGNGVGSAQMQLVCPLMSAGGTASATNIKQMVTAYASGRISKSLKNCKLMFCSDGLVIPGQLVGLSCQPYSAEHNLFVITASLAVPKLPGE